MKGDSKPAEAIPEPNESIGNRYQWEVYQDSDGKYYNAYLM